MAVVSLASRSGGGKQRAKNRRKSTGAMRKKQQLPRIVFATGRRKKLRPASEGVAKCRQIAVSSQPGNQGVFIELMLNHPFLQACGMFLGEMLCMVAFYVVRFYKKRRREQRAAISSGIAG